MKIDCDSAEFICKDCEEVFDLPYDGHFSQEQLQQFFDSNNEEEIMLCRCCSGELLDALNENQFWQERGGR
tara:strand:- start:978 stop:1190 length:213 start_codon:yes stop_codon:yes gene_type:complete